MKNRRTTIYLNTESGLTCLTACSIHNKNEIINFMLDFSIYCEIAYQKINGDNIYYKGYEFFKDFHGIVRFDKIFPIDSRFDILDL